jgi:hypothetical protein
VAKVDKAEMQLPPGRVYTFHSNAQAGCPLLDWHIVLEESGRLYGVIAWNDMQSFARATGNLNRQTNTFQMTAKEVGGKGRTATITGRVNTSSGWLTADIKGTAVNCTGIEVPWFAPSFGGGDR